MSEYNDSGSGAKAEGLSGPDAAAAFAEWRGHFPLAVTTIVPDANQTPTRHLKSPEEVAAVVRETSGKANIYYTHGTLLERVSKKPKKEHFAGTDFVHADLDPPKKSPDGILLSPEQIDQWVAQRCLPGDRGRDREVAAVEGARRGDGPGAAEARPSDAGPV